MNARHIRRLALIVHRVERGLATTTDADWVEDVLDLRDLAHQIAIGAATAAHAKELYTKGMRLLAGEKSCDTSVLSSSV